MPHAMKSPAMLVLREPFSGLFLPKAEVMYALIEDMKDRGYDEAFPVIQWGTDGPIVDGNTRVRAAMEAGVRVAVVERDFADENEALEYAIKCQRNRRNLSPAEMLRCLAELDKRKQQGERTDLAPAGAKLDDGQRAPKSAAETAKLLGTSPRQVERLRTIADAAPEEVKAGLASGDLSVRAAYDATIKARKAEAEPEPESDAETHSPEWWDWCDRAAQLEGIVKQLAAWEGQSAPLPDDYHHIMASLRQWQERAANETEE